MGLVSLEVSKDVVVAVLVLNDFELVLDILIQLGMVYMSSSPNDQSTLIRYVNSSDLLLNHEGRGRFQ